MSHRIEDIPSEFRVFAQRQHVERENFIEHEASSQVGRLQQHGRGLAKGDKYRGLIHGGASARACKADVHHGLLLADKRPRRLRPPVADIRNFDLSAAKRTAVDL